MLGVRSQARRRWVSAPLATVVALAVVVAACGTDDSGRELHGRAALSAPDPNVVPGTVGAVNRFATDLFRAYAGGDRGNFSLSPYVVAFTLGMVRAGAAGLTRHEIDQALHVEGGLDVDRGFATLAQVLAQRNGDRRTDTNKGRIDIMAPSALWGPRDTHFNDPFLDDLSANYDTAVHLVDMRTDPDGARLTINNWARSVTGGSVTQLVPRGVVTDQTSLVDVSAFSLQAPWATPLAPLPSGSSDFTPEGAATLDTRTIGATVTTGGRFAEGTGWKAAELPYLGGQLTMLLVIPDAGTFESYEEGFDGDQLRVVTDDLHAAILDVRMPRFQFQTDARLDGALKELGVRTVFDDRQSDLSGISPDGPLTLSSVSHQAYLDVNQNGTGTQTGSIAVTPPEQPTPAAAVRVTVDRPFIVLVRDNPTGLVLSIGRVVNPS